MKRKNLDTKAVKAVSLVAMVILFVMLGYNVVFNMRTLMAMSVFGMMSYTFGTLMAEVGLYSVVETMNAIEEDREE